MREANLPSRLDLFLGVLAILVVATSLGLANNRRNRPPLPLLGRLPKRRAGDVTLARLKLLLKNQKTTVLDARAEQVYKRSHIPGALNLPPSRFEELYPGLKSGLKDRTLVVYCGNPSCPKADKVRKKLLQAGHQHVRVLRPGYQGWVTSGQEVETEP